MERSTMTAGRDYAARVIEAAQQGQRVAPVSTAIPGISIAESYEVQRVLVAAALARGDAIVGYKGSLVTPGLRIGGIPVEPAVGVLLQSGDVPAGATIALGTFRQLVIECEIAFTFAEAVSTPIESIAALQAAVAAVQPAIELPDFALDGPMRTPADLIAINVAVSHQILGAQVAVDTPLANLAPTLARDGEVFATGDLAATIGDPWETLLTIVNLAVMLGHRIAEGQTILSGAIILAFDPQPGDYHADFGALGDIRFTVTP